MARASAKTGLIITIVVLAVLLIVVGVLFLTKKQTPATSSTNTDTSKNVTPDKTTPTATSAANSTSNTSSTPPAADPSTLSSIDIAPFGVTVFYTKGTPGFEYSVLKTADQTQYVQFTSSDLIGTKCTDDAGVFATIIKNPSDSEAQTISQTIKIGADTYGLSLSSPNCTGNDQLLTQYQTGFKNGFTSLKAL